MPAAAGGAGTQLWMLQRRERDTAMRLLAKREAGSLSAAEADELQQILASLIYTLSAGF